MPSAFIRGMSKHKYLDPGTRTEAGISRMKTERINETEEIKALNTENTGAGGNLPEGTHWWDLTVRVSVTEMMAVIIFFVLLYSGIFFIHFGTFDTAGTRYSRDIDEGAREAVDFAKYRMAYFVSPEKDGKVFASKISDPGIIYTVGLIDGKLSENGAKLERRFDSLEKEVSRLNKKLDRILKEQKGGSASIL